jgi:hypothetical protein
MMISKKDLEARAKALTRAALEKHPRLPEDVRQQLVLGIGPEDGNMVFELYVPGERPQDAVVFARTVLNMETGEGTVQVCTEAWTKLGVAGRTASS